MNNFNKSTVGLSSSNENNSVKCLRRTRMTATLRSMVRETELSKNDFIYPLFKDTFHMPTAAFNVSGEYSMVKAASKLGWDE